jgi:hypothetical protein
MGTSRRSFVSVAEASLVFTALSWALIAVSFVFKSQILLRGLEGSAIVIPDVVATWWVFCKLRNEHPGGNARRAAAAFAASALLASAIGYPLGELVGGYAEAILGNRFLLPSIAMFIIVVTILVTSVVVAWALHPSGGVELVNEKDQE